MAAKACCKFCDWQEIFPVAFLSATEVAALYEHALHCQGACAQPVDPRAPGTVLDRFAITQPRTPKDPTPPLKRPH